MPTETALRRPNLGDRRVTDAIRFSVSRFLDLLEFFSVSLIAPTHGGPQSGVVGRWGRVSDDLQCRLECAHSVPLIFCILPGHANGYA